MTGLDVGSRAVLLARDWLGTPYLHQASLKHIGCDCLGLVRGVWSEIYNAEPQEIPPYAPRWNDAAETDLLTNMANEYFVLQPNHQPINTGDILLFKYRMHLPALHIAISTSTDHFIHAYTGRGGCRKFIFTLVEAAFSEPLCMA